MKIFWLMEEKVYDSNASFKRYRKSAGKKILELLEGTEWEISDRDKIKIIFKDKKVYLETEEKNDNPVTVKYGPTGNLERVEEQEAILVINVLRNMDKTNEEFIKIIENFLAQNSTNCKGGFCDRVEQIRTWLKPESEPSESIKPEDILEFIYLAPGVGKELFEVNKALGSMENQLTKPLYAIYGGDKDYINSALEKIKNFIEGEKIVTYHMKWRVNYECDRCEF